MNKEIVLPFNIKYFCVCLFMISEIPPSLQISLGSDDVHLMTFGQPRIGNAVFASYFAKIVPNTIRVTHEHDIVPHLPPYFSFLRDLTYHHFPREVCSCINLETTANLCQNSTHNKKIFLKTVPLL
jgi:hypothetical protein